MAGFPQRCMATGARHDAEVAVRTGRRMGARCGICTRTGLSARPRALGQERAWSRSVCRWATVGRTASGSAASRANRKRGRCGLYYWRPVIGSGCDNCRAHVRRWCRRADMSLRWPKNSLVSLTPFAKRGDDRLAGVLDCDAGGQPFRLAAAQAAVVDPSKTARARASHPSLRVGCRPFHPHGAVRWYRRSSSHARCNRQVHRQGSRRREERA